MIKYVILQKSKNEVLFTSKIHSFEHDGSGVAFTDTNGGTHSTDLSSKESNYKIEKLPDNTEFIYAVMSEVYRPGLGDTSTYLNGVAISPEYAMKCVNELNGQAHQFTIYYAKLMEVK